MWAVETRDLTRTFGAFTAVDQISLKIRQGGIYGFLGPNGSGKSTTLKSISGLLGPERGQVTRGDVQFQGRSILQLGAPERVAATVIRVKKCNAVFHVFRYRVLFTFTQNLSRERVVKDLCFVSFRVVIPRKTAHQCSHVVHFKTPPYT